MWKLLLAFLCIVGTNSQAITLAPSAPELAQVQTSPPTAVTSILETSVPEDVLPTANPTIGGASDSTPESTSDPVQDPVTSTSPAPIPSSSSPPTEGKASGSTDETDPPALPDVDSGIVDSDQCADNIQCSALGLTGECCPTLVDGVMLTCCLGPLEQSCTANEKCKKAGLVDSCCPTTDKRYLDCCDGVPDGCKEAGTCNVTSTFSYLAEIESASESFAIRTNIVQMGLIIALFSLW